MNEQDRLAEELSAFLDGEACDASIEELLRSNASLARRRNEYARMGTLLRSLPDPDVHPAFVTRVVAHAVEAGAAGPAWRLWRFLAPAAGLAAVVLGLLVVRLQPDASSQRMASLPETAVSQTTSAELAAPAPLLRKDWTDEDQVVSEMARRLDTGEALELEQVDAEPDAALDADTAQPAESDTAEPLSPSWRQAIAREVFAYVSDPYWSAPEETLWFGPDYDEDYETLTAPEQAAFQSLLKTYQENG